MDATPSPSGHGQKQVLTNVRSLPPNLAPLPDKYSSERFRKMTVAAEMIAEVEQEVGVSDKLASQVGLTGSLPTLWMTRSAESHKSSIASLGSDDSFAMIRMKKNSTGSVASYMDNPFIALMSEAKSRKISADSVALSSPIHTSVPEHFELSTLEPGLSTRPPPSHILTPRTRPKALRNRGDVTRRRILTKQAAIAGSDVFENYQTRIFQRTHTNPSVSNNEAKHFLAPDAGSLDTSKPYFRRKSWNDGMLKTSLDSKTSENKSNFKRLTPARSTWSGSKKAPMEFQTVGTSAVGNTHKGLGIRKGFQKLGKFLVGGKVKSAES